MIVVIGLASAIIYGVSDFFGGLASRRIPALDVSLVSTVVAIAPIAVLTPVLGSVWSPQAVWLGATAGVLGAVGIWALYAVLAIGPMSVLSPTVAAVTAIIPAVVGIAGGERFAALGYVALGALVVAAALLGITRERTGGRAGLRAVLLAVLAGAAFGFYNVVIDLTPVDSGLVPLLADLVVGAGLFAAALLVVRARRATTRAAEPYPRLTRRGILLAIATGLLLAVANALLVIGLHLGELAIMGVLAALYPLGTVVLALALLRERLTPAQLAGVALAIAASVVLAFE